MDLNRIGELLRYPLVGGVGILGAFFINPKVTVWGPLSDLKDSAGLLHASVLFAIALTLGSLAYVAHRAAVYPLIHRCVLIGLCLFGIYPLEWKLLIPWIPASLELHLTRRGWKERETP